MQASLTFPPEGELISGDNPVYIGDMNRGESRTVSWTLVFTSTGIFYLDVNASGYRQDTGGYVEKHGYATVTVSACFIDIDVDTAYDMITSGLYPDLVVLDVRNQSEYDEGHIHGAVWIPVWELEARIGELAGHEDHEIMLYCRSGGRSVTASEILCSHNFMRVYNMLGGISAWQSAGYPVWIATVHNVNTTFNYDTIQAAIDAPQTLDEHTLLVDAGTYYENVVVNKSLTITGQAPTVTIVDGNRTGTVFHVTMNDVVLRNFTIQNSGGSSSGIHLDHSFNSSISDNKVVNNDRGILIYGCSGCSVSNNTVKKNTYGIRLSSSAGNILRNNTMADNQFNFGVSGSGLSHYINDVDASNTVEEKTVYYLINRNGLEIDPDLFPDVGYLALVNSTHISIKNLNLTRNYQGVLLAFTKNSAIQGVSTSDNIHGVHLSYSNNNIVNNDTVLNSYGCGIWLDFSSYNIVVANTVSKNTYGLALGGFLMTPATSNLIIENTICNNQYGLYSIDSTINQIYHNNFVNNTIQAQEIELWNNWDDGYPNGGNYWSNYTGIDLFSGPYQNMTGSDGIGDKPYDIGGYNQDRYPLMKPYGGPHDIGIVNVTTSETIVVQGHNLSINVKIVNYGANHETFNVTAYANQIIIQTKTITLTNRNSTSITFTWNTTGFAKGEYTISADVHPVPGETDTTDNTLIDGLVRVILQAHDVAVTDVIPGKTIVGKGCNVSINVTAENSGSYTETFNVTIYYNPRNATSIPIETQTVTLTSGNSTTLTFTWNTTGVSKGNYTITAYATPIPSETDTTDNTLTEGWIIVAMIGDITGPEGYPDGKCDMRDVAIIAILYGMNYADPRYNPNCDLSGPTKGVADGKIDMRDIAMAAKNFGKIDP